MIARIKAIIEEVDRLRYLRRAMTVNDALKLMCEPKTQQEIRIYLKMIGRHAYVRSHTTDLKCLEKVFIHNEYQSPFELSPRLIVDAGANIGMATLYFAHRYPDAQIVAIEPEPSNFEILRRNCADLSNVTLIKGALWPVNCPLEIEDLAGEAWTFRVRELSSRSNNAAVLAITISDILNRVDAQRIDFLKIDIEGAELQLFANGAEQWIDLVETIAIELHDRFRPGCARAFYSALGKRKFIQEIGGENLYVKLLDGET
jgi:FkbM family methyltransferase